MEDEVIHILYKLFQDDKFFNELKMREEISLTRKNQKNKDTPGVSQYQFLNQNKEYNVKVHHQEDHRANHQRRHLKDKLNPNYSRTLIHSQETMSKVVKKKNTMKIQSKRTDSISNSESKTETHVNGLTVIQQSNSSISQSRSFDSKTRERRSFIKIKEKPLLEIPKK
eukprot:CAMPEP_0205800882 /NCGR_PEP_ID=MMETSP0205-20121125/2683_1 /ASSEMBLY_ACC=CAM_ASM_000278 /TAXON_ID=36767 /ORGANISM="Euplotes focardii, Strain TN1" /LENGTH=167 /DNA_ID=CAMNT_0053064699 /DNA_START=446 /DNA_END=949 /DNA_ORIENTATION=+